MQLMIEGGGNSYCTWLKEVDCSVRFKDKFRIKSIIIGLYKSLLLTLNY